MGPAGMKLGGDREGASRNEGLAGGGTGKGPAGMKAIRGGTGTGPAGINATSSGGGGKGPAGMKLGGTGNGPAGMKRLALGGTGHGPAGIAFAAQAETTSIARMTTLRTFKVRVRIGISPGGDNPPYNFARIE